MKALRLGFVGAGGIAEYQMRYLKDIPGVTVVAAADVAAPAMEKFRAVAPGAIAYTDYRDMLRNEKLDAVSVCTPNALHKQPTIDALASGAHVLVEKPMAMNIGECRLMIESARKAGRQLVVGFQWRFGPAGRFMRRQVADGVIGDICYVRVQALRRRGIPSWGVFGRKELQGGGPLIDIGVHQIELAHAVMGKPRPISASASTFTYLGNKTPETKSPWGDWDWMTYTVEDLAVGFVRFEGGAVMAIESSYAAHVEKDVHTVQVMGTRGGVTSDPLRLFHDASGYMLDATPSFVGNEDPFAQKMKHFVEVARDGRENESSGEDGCAVQQILDGLYRSALQCREVGID